MIFQVLINTMNEAAHAPRIDISDHYGVSAVYTDFKKKW